MKCVRVVGQGIPTRLSDELAAQIVADGDGEYCPKHVWKQFHDKSADPDWRPRRFVSARLAARVLR